MRCPVCETALPEWARFCPGCGSSLALRCSRCAIELPPAARFCLACGAAVGAERRGAAADDITAALRRLVPQEFADRLLATRGQAGAERRLVTILFSDIVGYSTLASTRDPEEVADIISEAFEFLIGPVYRYEGVVAQLMGDAILAFFGAPFGHEDDPERAIRAGLEIQQGARAYATRLERERGITGFSVRVGINTGLVVVGEVGSNLRVAYTAVGDAINMAARMEQHAPPGGVLITHDTYRHVREVFDCQPQPPLTVKGHAEPMRTHLVTAVRPRVYRTAGRGLEGIEVRMTGRDLELAQLQAAFQAVAEDRERQVITVVGDAGVGKSRLLHEFERWLEIHPSRPRILKGRATAISQLSPYGLLRDLFARCFAILESDGAAVAREKLEQGIATSSRVDGPMQAHFVGHLLGFDFSDSPYLTAARDDPRELHDRARRYLADFFRGASAHAPVTVFLEDLHWADDSSLDALNQLALTLSDRPLLLVGATRPALLERRPHWGEGLAYHTRLDLRPLSTQASRRLVAEILQKVNPVPDALCELVVSGAEGNPFFAEELIKMLIEEGVIIKGTTGQDVWRVELKRLTTTRVPDTLSGVLQARLDRLALGDRSILQQAAVVGRQFWDQAVVQISRADGQEGVVPNALAALRTREMIFQRETSSFAGTQEYVFKHALLREVAYESLLKRLRRIYHGVVADWLIERGGERAGETSGLIGEHLELAGRVAEAADYLGRAAADAAAKFANEEAIRYYRRALAHWEQAAAADGQAQRQQMSLVPLYEGLGDVYELLSRKDEARAAYGSALAALPDDDRIRLARVRRKLANTILPQQVDERLKELAAAEGELGPPAAETDHAWWHEWLEIQSARMWSYYWGQRAEDTEQLAERIRPVLEKHGSLSQRSEFYRCLANASFNRNRCIVPDESLAHLRLALSCDLAAGSQRKIAMAHFNLGLHLLCRRQLSEAEPELRRGLELAEQIGDVFVQTIALTYLTMLCRLGNELDQARDFADRSMKTATKARLELYIGTAQAHLAWLSWRDGDFDDAEALGQAALSTLHAIAVFNPFRWIALWPLLAMASAREQFVAAAGLARPMLHPSQQRLPDALVAPLEAAIQAAESDQPESSRAHFKQAVTLAQQMGYL